MNLTPEQLEQCKAEFAKIYSNANDKNIWQDHDCALVFVGFRAAWRPMPAIEKIEAIIRDDVCGMCPVPATASCLSHQDRCRAGYRRQAKAIYKEFGGQP